MVKFSPPPRKFMGSGKDGACSSTAERYTVAVDVVGSKPIRLPKIVQLKKAGLFDSKKLESL